MLSHTINHGRKSSPDRVEHLDVKKKKMASDKPCPIAGDLITTGDGELAVVPPSQPQPRITETAALATSGVMSPKCETLKTKQTQDTSNALKVTQLVCQFRIPRRFCYCYIH